MACHMLAPKDDEIRSALISQLGHIFGFESVRQFLLQHDLYKNVGARAICWLVALGVIPAARDMWLSSLKTIYNNYVSLISHHFHGMDNPSDALSENMRHVIEADTHRTKPWFMRLCAQVGIQEEKIDGCEVRVRRIIACIALDAPQCEYTQGQDRFAWISYLVSLCFVIKGSMSADFAEALAFSLGKHFIERIEISKSLEKLPELEKRFVKLDALVKQEVPQVAEMLEQCGNTSVHYALKWRLTLFADEHTGYELMFLWDQILAREKDMDDFVMCLCVAHIKQVPIPEEADEMAVAIQRHRSWDMGKILADATELLERSESTDGCIEWMRRSVTNWFETVRGYRRLG